MNRFLAPILLCFATLAQAVPQTAPPLPPVASPPLTPPVAAPGAPPWLVLPCVETPALRPIPTMASKPICLPRPKGSGTSPIVEVNDYGAAAGWWCKQTAAKPPLLYLYAVRWEAVTPALVTDLLLGALASAQTSAIQSAQLKHQTRDIRDMCDVWGPAASRISAAMP